VEVLLIVGTTGGGTGGGTGVIAAPTTLNFFYQTGQLAPPSQYVIVGGSSTFTVASSVTTPSSGTWLSAAQYGGTNQVIVTAIPTGLAAQSTPYTGSITISSTSGSQTITVNLTVTSSPVLVANPGSLALSYVSGGSTPGGNVFLSASDSSNFTITGVTPTANWLTASATSTSVAIGTNPSSLAAGVYSAGVTITVTGGPYANSPFTIPVGLLVNGGVSSGLLSFSQSSLTFTPSPGASTVSQSLTISATTTTFFTVTYQTTNGPSGWLTVTPTQGYTPTSVTVQVNPANFVAGQTYNGTIFFTANGITQNVPVVAVVSGGSLTASTNSLTFTAQAGGAVTATQPVTVSSTGAQLAFTVTTSASWLKVDKTSASTQATINVSADPTGLAASSTPYTGTVTFTPSGGGTAATVSVSFTVTQAPPAVTTASFVSAAGFYTTDTNHAPLSPCALATVIATGLASTVQGVVAANAFGPMPYSLAGVSITFNNSNKAPILTVSNVNGVQQVNFQVPCELTPGDSIPVTVTANQLSTTVNVVVRSAGPGIFETTMSDGSRQAIILRSDGSLMDSVTNPVQPGETVVMFVTGIGPTSPAVATNSVPPLGQTVNAASTSQIFVGVNNAGVPFLSAQLSPDLVGIVEVRFQVPASTPNGTYVLSMGINAPTPPTQFSQGSKITVHQ
jgi:uncharacterized protein (TIGR03437 family)